METYCPSTRSAIETIKRFNFPLAPQRTSVNSFFPQVTYHRTIPPTVHIVRNRGRKEVRVRSIQELLDLTLGGDVEYQLGDYIETSWTHEGIRLELRLTPQSVTHQGVGEIVYRTRLRVIWGRKDLVPLSEPFSIRLSGDDELIVPDDVLRMLDALHP